MTIQDSFVVNWLSTGLPLYVTNPPLSGFTFVQSTAQAVWIVTHNLGRYPVAWSLYETSSGRLCGEYNVEHLSVNTCRVSMDTPTAGLIRLL